MVTNKDFHDLLWKSLFSDNKQSFIMKIVFFLSQVVVRYVNIFRLLEVVVRYGNQIFIFILLLVVGVPE